MVFVLPVGLGERTTLPGIIIDPIGEVKSELGGGAPMSFFGNVFKVAASVGRAVLGIPAAVKPAVQAVVAKPIVQTVARTVAGAGVAGAGFAAGDIALSSLLGDGGDALPLAAGGGNGEFVTQTLVVTRNKAGQIVRAKTLRGSPFLMNRDLAVAKRVLKTAGKLGRKFSRKTREKSQTQILMDVIQQKAIAAAMTPPPCPTT